MVFSSGLFLFFFLPLFFICYYLAPAKIRNAVILVFSLAFYFWGAPDFIAAVLLVTCLDFFIVAQLHRSEGKKRKVYLVVSLCLNLSLLFYFKYANFFVENTNALLHSLGFSEIKWVAIALPIGISFFVFESLTYAIDVYRKDHDPLKNLWDYWMYILMFPKMIAGPIVRYIEVADSITNREIFQTDIMKGAVRFIIGLSKKVLIANVLGELADEILNMQVANLNSWLAWIAILAYTFQIYFDFSGYSDMAIGLARMMGFRFPENFDSPYASASITEFWRRWHIKLGTWMRNYLYIPLGGNRVQSKWRLYFNLGFVFLVSGFWHGASWCFIIWGAYHGVLLILERLFLQNVLQKLPKLIAVFVTFFLVVNGWVVFRIEQLDQAMLFYKKLYMFDLHDVFFEINSKQVFCFILAGLFSWFILLPYGKRIQENLYFMNGDGRISPLALAIAPLLLVICIVYINTSSFNPFIYFRF